MDVILVHEKGIFVFESKNYSGWIFGSVEQQKWTQSFQNGEKYQFYNPIKQNATHCAAVATFLDVPSHNVTSYIVFSQRCVFKKIPDDTLQYKILHRSDLLRALRKELQERSMVFSPAQVDVLAGRLESAANVTKEEAQLHVQIVKARMEGTVCPYCGAELVKRNGKYGAFYGCTTYPKCKFIRNIK